ncbi:MAG: hypothetical protein CMP23_15295 [Rickettsiales bacterium]|nr:hypothetical protein [Rickettsiales bacterium]
MKVLLVSQYYPPETGGPPNRALSLARGLALRGHEVTVVAEKPSHPEGVIYPGYGGLGIQVSKDDGVRVLHTWVWASPDKRPHVRILNHLSFMISGLVASSRAGSADVVLVTSPPLFAAVTGLVAARTRKAALVLDIRDLWPELAISLGQLNSKPLRAAARWLERGLYRSADAVTAVTERFCAEIRGHTGATTPVVLVRNGTVPEQFAAADQREQLRAEQGCQDRFVVAYVGNIGLAQGLDHLIDAAEVLAGSNASVEFWLVGTGPARPGLEQSAVERGLTNVRFLDRADQQRAAQLMNAADALVVSLLPGPTLEKFVPSKLYDGLASRPPVLLGVAGEAAEILHASGGGLPYEQGNGAALAAVISELQGDPQRAQEMGSAGADYARANLARAVQAERMAELLEALAEGRIRPE